MMTTARLIPVPNVPDHVHTRFLVEVEGDRKSPRRFATRDGLDRFLARHPEVQLERTEQDA